MPIPTLARSNWKNLATDIRLWIGLFFLIRLIGITNPPLDPNTTGRQCDVLIIARNFYEVDSNIFFPRIDIQGGTQVVGVEFPVYNYLIFTVASVLGYDHWYGRLVNLIVVSIALFCFYGVLNRFFGKTMAFNTTLVFLFSSWFSNARVTIPDIFAGSLCIIALYMAFRYFEKGRWADFLIFFFLACLGCLSKISASSLLSVLMIPLLDRRILFQRKLMTVGAGAVTLVIVWCWYFYWVPHLNSIGHTGYFFMGVPISSGIRDIFGSPTMLAKRLLDDPLKYIGGALIVLSLVYSIRQKNYLVLFSFLIPFLTFCVFVLKSGFAFYTNGYYFLVVVPVMALIVGFGISAIQNRYVQFALLSAVIVENVANQVHVFESGPPYNTFMKLEGVFDSIGSTQNDKIVIGNDDNSPMAMYMSHRKGWNVPNEHLVNPNNVEALKNKGCKYALILKKIYSVNTQLPYPVVFDSEDFTIYKL